MQTKLPSAVGDLDPNDPKVQAALAQQAQWKANPTDNSPQMGVGNTESAKPLAGAALSATPAIVSSQPSHAQEVGDKTSPTGVNLSPISEAKADEVSTHNNTPAPKPGVAEALWEGFNEGLSHYTDQLAKPYFKYVEGRSDQEIQSMVDQRNQGFKEAQNTHSIAFGAGQVGADVAAFGVAAGLTGAAGIARTGLAEIGTSATQGALLGLAKEPGEGESRLGNAATDAALFGGVTAAGNALIGVGSSLLGVNKAAKDQINQMASIGLDTNVLNVSKSNFVKTVGQNLASSIPLSGDIGTKIQQGSQLEGAIRAFADNVAGDTKGNTFAVADAINNKYKEVYKTVDGLFDDVDVAAKNSGNNSIPLSQTQQAVKDLLNDPKTTKSVQATLKQYPELLSGGQGLDYAKARELRTNLGREVTQVKNAYASGNTEVGINDSHALGQVFGSIHNDIDNWAMNSAPEVARAYTKAVGFFKNANATFKDRAPLMNAIKDRASLQDFSLNMFNAAKPNISAKNFDIVKDDLPAVRSNIITNALNKNLSKENSSMPLNITGFLNDLKKPGDNGVQMIWGDQYNNLMGLEKSLKSIDQSVKTNNIPSSMKLFVTGSLLTGGGLLPAMGIAGSAPLTAAIAAPFYAVTKLMTSPRAAKMLSHWSRISDAAPDAVKKNLTNQTLAAFKDVLGAGYHNKAKMAAYEYNQSKNQTNRSI